jgi:hypothetical protein
VDIRKGGAIKDLILIRLLLQFLSNYDYFGMKETDHPRTITAKYDNHDITKKEGSNG